MHRESRRAEPQTASNKLPEIRPTPKVRLTARVKLWRMCRRKSDDCQREKEAETKAEEERVKDAIKFTADFYKTVTEKFGEHSSKVAKELAEAAKGKSIKMWTMH